MIIGSQLGIHIHSDVRWKKIRILFALVKSRKIRHTGELMFFICIADNFFSQKKKQNTTTIHASQFSTHNASVFPFFALWSWLCVCFVERHVSFFFLFFSHSLHSQTGRYITFDAVQLESIFHCIFTDLFCGIIFHKVCVCVHSISVINKFETRMWVWVWEKKPNIHTSNRIHWKLEWFDVALRCAEWVTVTFFFCCRFCFWQVRHKMKLNFKLSYYQCSLTAEHT